MRIALKPVTASSTLQQAADAKSSATSFLDMLTRVSSDSTQELGSGRTDPEARSNTSSDNQPSSQNETLQSSGCEVEGIEDERGLAQSLMVTCRSNANIAQDDQAANATQSLPTQHCTERSITQQSQSKTEAVASSEYSNAILTIPDQIAAVRPAEVQAISSVSTISANPQAAEAEQTNSLPDTATAALVSGRDAQEKVNVSPSLASSAIQVAGLPIHPNSVAPLQNSDADTIQNSLRAPDTQKSPSGTALAEIVAQECTVSASFGEGNTFLQGSSLPTNFDGMSSSSKSGQFSAVGTTIAVNSAGTISTNAGNSFKSSTLQDGGAALSGAQTNGQLSQHLQTDVSQTATIVGMPTNNSSAQPIVFGSHEVQDSSVQSHFSSGGTDATPLRSEESRNSTLDQVDSGITTGTSVINSARLVQSISETEMRLGMHSAEFGDISIRTSVSQQQMQAQISVDHDELGNAISAHIPVTSDKAWKRLWTAHIH